MKGRGSRPRRGGNHQAKLSTFWADDEKGMMGGKKTGANWRAFRDRNIEEGGGQKHDLKAQKRAGSQW